MNFSSRASYMRFKVCSIWAWGRADRAWRKGTATRGLSCPVARAEGTSPRSLLLSSGEMESDWSSARLEQCQHVIWAGCGAQGHLSECEARHGQEHESRKEGPHAPPPLPTYLTEA